MNDRGRTVAAAIVIAVALGSTAVAETARDILDEIAAANDARRPKDVTQTFRMWNVRNGVVELRREVETLTKLGANDTAKTLTFFLSPFDIKGVGFLAWTDPRQRDVQWLYQPKLHRVRQIGPALSRQSFQDTVFTYEDLELFAELAEWDEDEAATRLVAAAEPLDGAACAVIELVPKRESVSYGRFLLWFHRPDATLRKSELYDRSDGALSKRAQFAAFASVGQLPIAGRTELENVKTGLRTIIEVIETRLDEGLDEEMFTPWYLERAAR